MAATPEASALHRLATYVGVLTSYEDVFHETHPASDAAMKSILTAMHFDVSSEERAAQSLVAYARRNFERGLEPVYVLSANVSATVTVFARRDGSRAPYAWTLTGEDGKTRTGSSELAADVSDHPACAAGIAYERLLLSLELSLDEGYYDLTVTGDGREMRARLIVAPPACYLPPAMERHGLWGLAAHVYALRSRRTNVAGDFTDLATLCATVRDAGGSAVAVNPLHLLPRGSSSPYGPSSRTYVNWAYLDVTALPGYEPRDGRGAEAANEDELVDYETLYRVRALDARAAFERFQASGDAGAKERFDAYVREGGDDLRRAAIFESLADRFRQYAGVDDWRSWPDPYHDPASDAIEAYARDNADDVAFYTFLQWQCDVQLTRVAEACGGMPIGLYRDLAVGTQLGGVDTWLERRALLSDVGVGAPPDLFNRGGQNWGVAPFDPIALRAAGYEPFIKLLRANARHAGALRIDHVMGLLRLWWVPSGLSADDGAYVSYPLDEMLAVLALESHRAKCLIVGEDLGTVPPGFRERMEAARLFSYRVLQFEHDDADFVNADAYPKYALAATGTHDLPTMPGFWNGTDIDLRERFAGKGDTDESREARTERDRMREALLRAFAAAGVALDDEREIAAAANAFLAKTPSLLLMLSLEDVLGETEQLNVPSSGEYPNWRHRNALDIGTLATDGRFLSIAHILQERRF